MAGDSFLYWIKIWPNVIVIKYIDENEGNIKKKAVSKR